MRWHHSTATSTGLVVSNTGHAEGHGDTIFAAVCDLGLEGIVSKRVASIYRSGPSRTWIKIKSPQALAVTRVLEGGF